MSKIPSLVKSSIDPTHSVRFRLSSALAVLFAVVLLVSGIGLGMLRNAEGWLETVHRETLTEVSNALGLSRDVADLATSAPFLITVQIPALLAADVQSTLKTIARIEKIAGAESELSLPLARMRSAILDIERASVPKSALEAELKRIDRDLIRLQNRFNRRADIITDSLNERLYWARLQQLTAEVLGAARAQELIAVGEFNRRYLSFLKRLPEPETISNEKSLNELVSVIGGKRINLFELRHQILTAQLDSENALFRIRRASDQLATHAATMVSDAEQRLTLARAETSRNLAIAQRSVFALALISLVIAIGSGMYVWRYVAANLRHVADAMRRLAAGDLRTDLPYKLGHKDEIGQLFDAFSVFRANARKLERHANLINKQNALFARVFQNINDGVAIISADGQIEAENAQVRELLRLPKTTDLKKETPHALIERSAFSHKASEVSLAGVEEYADQSGHVLEIRQSQLPDGGSVWLFSETTERRRIDERLEEIRRVESLGKLTGEVAHDFGNILSTISGNLHLIETTDKKRIPEHLSRITAAVDLGVTLTERLLAFARKQQLEPEVTDIGELLEGMQDLLSIALPSDVIINMSCDEEGLCALIDPGQMESAILNLCINAGQAINGEGTVSISVGRDEPHMICLSINDDGCGMSPETLRRASEPFFTNRSDGTGTGLGLSMVHGFIHQSGGSMQVESEPDIGTKVVLTLPAYRLEDDRKRIDRMSGSALVVDDNETTALYVAKILRNVGMEPQVATNMADGQTILAAQPEIDLLITDLYLDQDNLGWDLIRSYLEEKSDRHAILMSSQLPDHKDLNEGMSARCEMISKPMKEQDLLAIIRRQM